jgi:hypothetical protein
VVRTCSGWTFGALVASIVLPLVLISGTHLNRGVFPYLVGALIVCAVIFSVSWLAARRLRPPDTNTPVPASTTFAGPGRIEDSDLDVRSSADRLVDGPNIVRSRLNADHQPGRQDWSERALDSDHGATQANEESETETKSSSGEDAAD